MRYIIQGNLIIKLRIKLIMFRSNKWIFCYLIYNKFPISNKKGNVFIDSWDLVSVVQYKSETYVSKTNMIVTCYYIDLRKIKVTIVVENHISCSHVSQDCNDKPNLHFQLPLYFIHAIKQSVRPFNHVPAWVIWTSV